MSIIPVDGTFQNEEYLHRRVADILRVASKLQDDLQQSKEQRQVLLQRVAALETSDKALKHDTRVRQSENSHDDAERLEEIAELKSQLENCRKELLNCTREVQERQEENGKLWVENIQYSRQHTDLSEIHRHETEEFRTTIQDQQAEIIQLRQLLDAHAPDDHLQNVKPKPEHDDLLAKIMVLEKENKSLEISAETSNKDKILQLAEIETGRSLLSKAQAEIKRLQTRKNASNPSSVDPRQRQAISSNEQNRQGTQQDSDRTRAVESANIITTSLSALPPKRKDAIAPFPLIATISEAHSKNALFSRHFLSQQLGGGTQSLIVGVAAKNTKALGQQYSISVYLCPNQDHNPWCPTEPGMHGYIFVGLGREKGKFETPETRHVFVGLGAKQYRYMGFYEASMIEKGLEVDEWDPLPEHFKTKYVETTVKKSIDKEKRTESQTRAAYDLGNLRVPLVQLKCIGFDQGLFNDLVQAKDGHTSISTSSRKRSYEGDGFESASRKSARHSK